MTVKTNIILAGALLLASTGLARAEMVATTINDLNIRSGPGPQYPSAGLATRGSTAVLGGCIEGSRWCRIDVNGVRGWAYAQYLEVQQNGAPMIVEEHRADLGVPSVTYEQPDGMIVSSVQPPVQPSPDDDLIGPVEEVDPITPPTTVRTYIDENPVDAVRLNGDVVVGATVPQTVTVRTIPDYQYSYMRVNDRPVLVDPGTRRIVYVYN
ncbi:DUF1236 domain-containing protein [Rhizobium sp. BK251]|uniref:DUF1236 domain-containing protein n=1 Tax=Rhizobium sp. BK251 TaxID=2512125 RepID=UPI0010454560|nr:DUF1236 domain-containing protein [Rhizobium sp. BK251]TCL74784.1 SH3 domain-containing protein [Rhizobium sp. BK251]